jgi:hypothetical protein
MAYKKTIIPKRSSENPRNPENPLYKALTRLFSGPIVNYRHEQVRKYRRKELDKFNWTSASGKEFEKADYEKNYSFYGDFMLNQNRSELYLDFEQMEYMPELNSALDIYADEMTTATEVRKMLTVDCPNQEIKTALDILYYDVLNVDLNLYGWARTLCKYGDFFLYLDIDERIGIQNVVSLPVNEIERLEGQDENNPNYLQFQWNSGGLTFEDWQIAHFRVLGNNKYNPYGTSVLEGARRIWRQLTLVEDAMMSYRIVRAPERRVFYVDVGAVSPQDVETYMQQVMTTLKRNQIVDADSGRVDLRYNPMSVEEDYYIPVRGGTQGTKIETLAGGQFTSQIEDVKYLREKLFSAIKIPQAYLVAGENAEDRTSLSQKDIRFARTIQRLQKALVSELTKIGMVHLYTLGFRKSDLTGFKLKLNNPSRIAELQDLETMKTQFEVASSATEGFFSKRYIAERIFNISQEEFLRNQREMFFDRKFASLLDSSAAAASETEETTLGGGDLGGFGMETETPGEETPGEETPEAGGEEAAPEEDILKVAPGKRDDEPFVTRDEAGRIVTTTPASKGKMYRPKKDGRVKKLRMGMRSTAVPEFATGNTRRSKLGLPKPSDLFEDVENIFEGMVEKKETNYTLEEGFEDHSKEVDRLLESLEKRNDQIQ